MLGVDEEQECHQGRHCFRRLSSRNNELGLYLVLSRRKQSTRSMSTFCTVYSVNYEKHTALLLLVQR